MIDSTMSDSATKTEQLFSHLHPHNHHSHLTTVSPPVVTMPKRRKSSISSFLRMKLTGGGGGGCGPQRSSLGGDSTFGSASFGRSSSAGSSKRNSTTTAKDHVGGLRVDYHRCNGFGGSQQQQVSQQNYYPINPHSSSWMTDTPSYSNSSIETGDGSWGSSFENNNSNINSSGSSPFIRRRGRKESCPAKMATGVQRSIAAAVAARNGSQPRRPPKLRELTLVSPASTPDQRRRQSIAAVLLNEEEEGRTNRSLSWCESMSPSYVTMDQNQQQQYFFDQRSPGDHMNFSPEPTTPSASLQGYRTPNPDNQNQYNTVASPPQTYYYDPDEDMFLDHTEWIQSRILLAKKRAQTVKLMNGDLYIDYKYIGPVPHGVRV